METDPHTRHHLGGALCDTVYCSGYFYLNDHVIDDEEEVDDFRSHDEDMQPTGGLVEADGLQLTPELECSWPGLQSILINIKH